MLPVKNENYVAFFRSIVYSCQMTSELHACRIYLSNFQRNPGQDFATSIQLFDSVYSHYCHLQAPRRRQKCRGQSRSTPFLLSETTAKVFTQWAEEHSYTGRKNQYLVYILLALGKCDLSSQSMALHVCITDCVEIVFCYEQDIPNFYILLHLNISARTYCF